MDRVCACEQPASHSTSIRLAQKALAQLCKQRSQSGIRNFLGQHRDTADAAHSEIPNT